MSVEEFQQSLQPGNVDYSLVQSWMMPDRWNMDKLNDLPLSVRTNIVLNVPCNIETQACPIWKPTLDGYFSTATARQLVRDSKQVNTMFAIIWSPFISPTIFCLLVETSTGMDICRMQDKKQRSGLGF